MKKNGVFFTLVSVPRRSLLRVDSATENDASTTHDARRQERTAFRVLLRALMSLSAHGGKASIFYLQSPRATELNVETRETLLRIADISRRDYASMCLVFRESANRNMYKT